MSSTSAPDNNPAPSSNDTTGVVANEDTAVVLRCTAPPDDAAEPVYLGPLRPLPVLLGVGGGILLGLALGTAGLVLTIIGIVRRVRSAR